MPCSEDPTHPAVWEHGNRGQDGGADGIDSQVDKNGAPPRPGPDMPGAWPTEVTNPFAQMPTTLESIIAQVRRQLADDAPRVITVEPIVLDQVAERAVRELWGSRIKTFVPVLALRQAREILRDQELGISMPCPDSRRTKASMALPPLEERLAGDVLSVYEDVMMRDGRRVP
jgi:hypothetical protein